MHEPKQSVILSDVDHFYFGKEDRLCDALEPFIVKLAAQYSNDTSKL
jgi:alpha/beta superfamily hydrolase